MSDRLNPPEKIIQNINGAAKRIEKVDQIIGEDLKKRFAEGVSRLLFHMETGKPNIAGIKEDDQWKAKFAIQLVSASTEFETAWHSMRLSNIPACYRQSRVGFECIGFSILLAIPVNQLKQLSTNFRLIKQIKKHPDKSLFELFSPEFIKENKTETILKPKILGNYIIPAFFEASDKIIGIEKSLIHSLKIITEQTFHPSSHNSMHNFAYHFEAFSTEKSKAGAMFSEERSETLIKAAENLGNLTHILADIMDSTYDYLYELDK